MLALHQYSIFKEICTWFILLLCFVGVCFYPFLPSSHFCPCHPWLLHRYWGNPSAIEATEEHGWAIYHLNRRAPVGSQTTWYKFTNKIEIKPCAYSMGYTVCETQSICKSCRWLIVPQVVCLLYQWPRLRHCNSNMAIVKASCGVTSQIARSMGPTWGLSGAGRTQLGPMLAPWTLLSGIWKLWKTRWLETGDSFKATSW